jgi:hypothetical protein
MKPTLSKDARRAEAIDKGARIANFLSDPAIVDYLDDAYRRALESVLTVCEGGASPDQVTIAATRLSAIRGLSRYLRSVAADGERALKQIEG